MKLSYGKAGAVSWGQKQQILLLSSYTTTVLTHRTFKGTADNPFNLRDKLRALGPDLETLSKQGMM